MAVATSADLSLSRKSLHFFIFYFLNFALLSDPLNILWFARTQKHTQSLAHTLLCTALDTGGAVLHDRRGLVFMFVGAVFQRAGAL